MKKYLTPLLFMLTLVFVNCSYEDIPVLENSSSNEFENQDNSSESNDIESQDDSSDSNDSESQDDSSDSNDIESQDQNKFLPLKYGFETSLDHWKSLNGGIERFKYEDIEINSSLKIEGIKSCKFTVSPSSIISGGNRAELKYDQGAIEGDLSWYEYSFFIPENYRDVPIFDELGKSNWQILGQWHQKPVKEDGENWASFTGKGESPPIAIYYTHLLKNDKNYSLIKDRSIFGFDSNWDNVSTIRIVIKKKAIAIVKIEKGEWINLKFNIGWSQGDDGFIQVWKNGKEITNGKYYGPNMANKASHFFKFGLYRNGSIPYTNEIYYDNVNIW